MVISSHEIVKRLLEDFTQYELKFFSLVMYEGKEFYLCISRHSIFLVNTGLTYKEQIYLAWVKRVVLDTEDVMVFKLELDERAAKYLETPIRQDIVNELQVYWKTDYMIRRREVKEFPVVQELVTFDQKVARKGTEFTKPPPGFDKVSHQGYFFFVKKEYEREKVSDDVEAWEQQTVVFARKESDATLWFTVSPPVKVSNLARREKMGLRLTAERLARTHIAAEEDFVVISSDDYRKKMNLTGDPATWKCYAAHLRTENRDIGVIVARRKFIPPFGDTAQDLVFMLLGPSGRFDSSGFMDPLERMVDCISAENQNYFFDQLVIKAKLDGLMCDDEAFRWYQVNLDLYPQMIHAVRAFVKSVATLIEDAGVDISADELEREAPLFRNPFEIIDDINNEAPDIGEEEENPAIIEAWRRKVSRYLAYCIDGGLHSELKLNDLVKATENSNVDPAKRDIYHRLIEYFVYLRAKNDEYVPERLLEKVLDDQLMSNFTVNERVLCRLMEIGYIQRVLADEVEPGTEDDAEPNVHFIHFVYDLLNKPHVSPELLSACLAQIALMSKNQQAQSEMVGMGVVGVLLDILKTSEDDIQLLSCVKALVNLSANNDNAKHQIVLGGAVRAAIPHLTYENEELATAFCGLLKNCMNTVEHREKIGRGSVVPALVNLLKTGRSSDPLLAAAASCLWNIAANETNVTRILRAGGLGKIVALFRRNKVEAVLEKLCGCMMVLATGNDDVKKDICELGAVPILVALLTSTKNIILLRNVCGVLAFISSDDEALVAEEPRLEMRKDNVQDGLELCMKSRERHIMVFGQQVLDRIEGND